MTEETADIFDGPEWLEAEARVFWTKIAPDLKLQGLLRVSEEETLGRYCDALARWHKVRLRVNKQHETYETDSNHGRMLRVNPDFKVLGELESWLTAFEDRYGLSPLFRYKLKALRQNVGETGKDALPLAVPAAFGVPPDPDGEIPGEREPASPFGGMASGALN